MEKTGHKCIECGTETVGIQLIDRCESNVHHEMEYAAEDARRKFTGVYDAQGKVLGELCENCGRITLRAATKK